MWRIQKFKYWKKYYLLWHTVWEMLEQEVAHQSCILWRLFLCTDHSECRICCQCYNNTRERVYKKIFLLNKSTLENSRIPWINSSKCKSVQKKNTFNHNKNCALNKSRKEINIFYWVMLLVCGRNINFTNGGVDIT